MFHQFLSLIVQKHFQHHIFHSQPLKIHYLVKLIIYQLIQLILKKKVSKESLNIFFENTPMFIRRMG